MSKIQNNFIKLWHPLIYGLKLSNLNGSERKILDAIMWKSYRWNKSEVSLSHSNLIEETSMIKVTVIRALNGLREKGIVKLIKKGVRGTGNTYKIEKDIRKWKGVKVVDTEDWQYVEKLLDNHVVVEPEKSPSGICLRKGKLLIPDKWKVNEFERRVIDCYLTIFNDKIITGQDFSIIKIMMRVANPSQIISAITTLSQKYYETFDEQGLDYVHVPIMRGAFGKRTPVRKKKNMEKKEDAENIRDIWKEDTDL